MRSNAGMSKPNVATTHESRLDELEIKSSFMEDTLDRLNEVIVRQQQQIELLMREVLSLRDQQAGSGLPAARSLRDDLPPHY
jgi:SlyX protein